MEVVRATALDGPAIERLLDDAGLPTVGAIEAFANGVVARDGTAVVGAAALELYGRDALLRSVVVDSEHRGAGIGRQLVDAAEDLARDAGVTELFLMTETAAAWFPRLGYEIVDREVARSVVGESIEFTLSCATNGVAMRRRLGAR